MQRSILSRTPSYSIKQETLLSSNKAIIMRLSVVLVCLMLGVAVAAGLDGRLRRDADDISTETAVFRQGRQDVYPLCEFVYNALTSVLPDVLEDVITALTMVPTFLLVFVLGLLIPGSNVFTQAFIDCWKSATTEAFGLDPTAALVRIDGAIQGDIFFAQTLEREGKPSSLAVVGKFEGLVPGQRYQISVHNAGDVSDSCAYVGEQFSSLGGAKVTAGKDGKALLMLQDTSVLLDGTSSVMGRSVVVTPVGGGVSSCGVIARNIVKL